jgi:hypothetical protein
MGKYDNIQPDQLRAALTRFARLILRLEADGVLLQEVPNLQRAIGNLRQMLFAYEVRCTPKLPKKPPEQRTEDQEVEDPVTQESLRIVREALEQEKRMRAEWGRDGPGGDSDTNV